MRAAIVPVILWFSVSLDAASLQWSRMPTNIIVELGGTAVFSGAAQSSDLGPFAYQWFKDYEEIPGATNDTLVISNVTYPMQSHQFILWASVRDDPLSRRNSNPAFLTIPHSPPVTRFPQTFERSLIVASNLIAVAQVTGEPPLHYQWFDGPRLIYGETSSSIQIQHTFSRGPYYALVSNIFGVTTGTVWNVNLMYPPDVASASYRTGMVGTALQNAPDGDWYALRNNPGTLSQPAGGFEIARINSNFDESWRLEFRGTANEAGAIRSETNGNVFIWAKFDRSLLWSNYVLSSSSSLNGVLIKLSPAGEILAMQHVGKGETEKAIALAAQGNALWTLENARTNLAAGSFVRPLLRTFDLDGNPLNRLVVTNFPAVPLSTNGSITALHFAPKISCSPRTKDSSLLVPSRRGSPRPVRTTPLKPGQFWPPMTPKELSVGSEIR
jgi:hypothetical protein